MNIKKYMALSFLTLVLASVVNAANLQWSSIPTTLAPSSVTATYTAALYTGPDAGAWASSTPIFTYNFTGSSLFMQMLQSSPQSPSMASLGLDNGSQIYTRLFNASTVGAATYSAGTAGGVHTVVNYAALNAVYSYNSGASQTWQAVPEPTTLALLGVGILGLTFRRKR